MVRRRFVLALMASMALHVTLLSGAGWRLPLLDDLLEPERLEASLAPAPRPAARPAAPARPAPRPKAAAAPATPAPVAAMPAGEPVIEEAAVPLPAPVEAPPVAETAPAVASPTAGREIALPRKGRIRYDVRWGEGGMVVGRVDHEWRHDGTAYTLRSVAETTGLAAVFRPAKVVQASEGEVADGGLRPREFRTEKNGVAGDRARFDWAAGRVALSAGARELPLEPGSQDLLSMFYQLGLMAVESGDAGFAVATGRKLERYGFEVVGEEVLVLAAGERRVLHVRTRAAAGAESTEIWLGLDAYRLPLKIRHTDRKRELYDQVAEEIELEERR